jgi:hypothetical protein
MIPRYFVWRPEPVLRHWLPSRPTEQKAAKTFEQKAAKVTKSLSAAIYVDVLQASPLRLHAISENKPVDAVFQHDLVKVDQ